MKTYLTNHHLKNILYLLLFLPLCLSCKKDIGDPLPQLHFIDFVDVSGQNLFESGKIDTTQFFYISGDLTANWAGLRAGKDRSITYFFNITPDQTTNPDYYTDRIDSLRKNDNILVEDWEGNLERERVISINGVIHTFRYSLKKGFYEDGKKIESSTDVIDKNRIYLHHLVLEAY